MAYKIVFLSVIVAVTNAGFIGGGVAVTRTSAIHSSPVFYGSSPTYHGALPVGRISAASLPKATISKPASAAKAVADAEDNFEPNPSYSYSYDVKDAGTGDSKTMSESLENGVVKGSYSVIDPDGNRRTVQYTADATHGFNAVVNNEPYNFAVKSAIPKAVIPSPIANKAVISTGPAFYDVAPAEYKAAPGTHHAPVTKVISPALAKVVPSSPNLYGTFRSSFQPSTVTYHAATVHH